MTRNCHWIMTQQNLAIQIHHFLTIKIIYNKLCAFVDLKKPCILFYIETKAHLQTTQKICIMYELNVWLKLNGNHSSYIYQNYLDARLPFAYEKKGSLTIERRNQLRTPSIIIRTLSGKYMKKYKRINIGLARSYVKMV